MTPEDRAKELRASLAGVVLGLPSDALDIITKAFREAEEEASITSRRQALEEAARVLDGRLAEWQGIDRCNPRLFGHIATEIRGLKGLDYSVYLAAALAVVRQQTTSEPAEQWAARTGKDVSDWGTHYDSIVKTGTVAFQYGLNSKSKD